MLKSSDKAQSQISHALGGASMILGETHFGITGNNNALALFVKTVATLILNEVFLRKFYLFSAFE